MPGLRDEPGHFSICTLVTLCDAPYFTITCVQGGHALFNPAPGSCDGVVGVERRTWTGVKRLFE
jgi:hypothetical protein